MGHVKYASDVTVPVEAAFNYVDTYRNVPNWAYGITSFEPIGNQERGLGAAYRAVLKLGPKLFTFQCQVTSYRPDALLTISTSNGPVRTFTLRVDPLGRGITVLTLEVDYTTPRGLGRPLRSPAAALVGAAMRRTETQLRREIEGSHGAGLAGHYLA